MFLPDSNHKDDKEERKAACTRVEELTLEQVPEELRETLQISVQEVQCGDPDCSPIDTAITFIFNRQVVLLYISTMILHFFFEENGMLMNFTRIQKLPPTPRATLPLSFFISYISLSLLTLSLHSITQWRRWNDWNTNGGQRSD